MLGHHVIKHTHTTPYHLQAKSVIEIISKTDQKDIVSFLDATTLNWPLLVAPMRENLSKLSAHTVIRI